MVEKKYIFDLIDDLVADFLYYDRKEDEKVPRGMIERLVRSGEISRGEIAGRFRETFEKCLKNDESLMRVQSLRFDQRNRGER